MLRVLHLFESYLPPTENWIFQLLRHLPDSVSIIATKEFLKTNFYSNAFEYIEFPIGRIQPPSRSFWIRAYNRAVSVLMNVYPRYIRARVMDVDIMHSHFAVSGWYYRDLARKLGIPHIVSFYGYDYEYLPY